MTLSPACKNLSPYVLHTVAACIPAEKVLRLHKLIKAFPASPKVFTLRVGHCGRSRSRRNLGQRLAKQK